MTPMSDYIQQAGALAVLVTLLLSLAVILLRLAALPLAAAALLLDQGADLAARPLTYTPPNDVTRETIR